MPEIIVRTNEPPTQSVAPPATPPVEAKEKPASAPEVQEPDESESTDVSETSATEGEELQAKDGEDQAEETAEGNKEEPRAKKPGVVKRIDKLTRKNSDLKREVEYWREQAMRGQTQKPPESKGETKVTAEGKPNPNDFETHEAFVEALTDWKLEQKLKDQERVRVEKELKTEVQKKQADYAAKVQAFTKEHPEFNEVAEECDEFFRERGAYISLTVQDAIFKHGPELAMELAKDPEELMRICSLPVEDAREEIGMIRARMRASKEEPKTETKLTKAPKPPTPIASKSATPKKSIFDEDISQSEYERIRREQMRRKNA